MPRVGRKTDELRPVEFRRGYTKRAPGSVLVEMGQTRVLCTASLDRQIPAWLEGKGQGWLTAEYSMLPGSTLPRKARDKGKPDGRAVEIQRLIGRSLRAVVNLKAFEGRTLWVDCDVLDADGGTRTASITGAYVAAVDAVRNSDLASLAEKIFTDSVAAISVGVIEGEARLDLDYREDVVADVDMNLVMTGSGRFIELQGTAEHATFDQGQLLQMVDLGRSAVRALTAMQREILGTSWPVSPVGD